jgi:hypothetical protein
MICCKVFVGTAAGCFEGVLLLLLLLPQEMQLQLLPPHPAPSQHSPLLQLLLLPLLLPQLLLLQQHVQQLLQHPELPLQQQAACTESLAELSP